MFISLVIENKDLFSVTRALAMVRGFCLFVVVSIPSSAKGGIRMIVVQIYIFKQITECSDAKNRNWLLE